MNLNQQLSPNHTSFPVLSLGITTNETLYLLLSVNSLNTYQEVITQKRIGKHLCHVMVVEMQELSLILLLLAYPVTISENTRPSLP